MGFKNRRAFTYTNKRNNSRAAACVSGYLNPFKDHLQNIKIPDGAANMSCGIRYTDKFLIENSNVDDQLYFVIGPDKEKALFSNKSAVQVPGGQFNPANSDANTHLNVIPSATITQYRMVSKGTRIIPTMNSDNNEGYFEAIRVPSVEPYDFTDMTSNPSYVNGKLKDLSRYVFQNKPLDTSHPFIHNIASEKDPSFDTILIKCSGVSKTLGTLLVHCVANWEFQFIKTATADFRRFMDGAVNDQNGLHRAQAILMSSIKAANLSAY
jgi:hypothetical protein